MPHDYTPHESGEPRQIDATGDQDVFETLTRAAFQSGLSWQVVGRKWAGIADAFANFDVATVAAWDAEQIGAVLERDDVIRSKQKVAGTVKNAATLLAIAEEHGDFFTWVRGLEDYWAREKAITKRFKWVGEFGAYWVLYTLKEPVPHYAEWCRAKGRPVPAGLA